jgi:amino acid transporter
MAAGLRPVLSLWQVVFYGLGVIVGAGIYVAIGSVIARAGEAAPLSFLLAGGAAGLTGLCYAELAGRFPEAAGAVSYVRHGFGSDRLALATGIAVTVAVAVSAASIARGAANYLVLLVPLPTPLLVALLVVAFTLIAAWGVRESVGLAATIGAFEIAGLAAAAAVGFAIAPEYHLRGMLPADAQAWQGTVAGAFIAFFAFIGFETLVNLAEETIAPERTLPRGIIGAIGASIVLYIVVVTAVVLADTGTENPLLALFGGVSATLFAVVATVSIANGVLVQIVMLARLFYGMAARGQLPDVLARVHPYTETPIPATIAAGGIVLAAVLLLPFERLLALSNAVTLAVFVLVDLALGRVHRRGPAPPGRWIAPAWAPPLGAAVSLLLMLAEIVYQFSPS